MLSSNKQPTSASTKAEQSKKDERTGGFWTNKDQMGLDEKKEGGHEGPNEWERGNVGERVLGVDGVIPCIAGTVRS